MKEKKLKKGEIETRKLVSLIIVLVVLVVVVFFIAFQSKEGVIKNLLKILPDFVRPQITPDRIVECPINYKEIGYIDNQNYIILNGKKTNFYLDNGKIFLKVPLKYDYGRDQLLGYVENNVINLVFPKNLDEREIEFRSLFPEEKDRRFLPYSKIFEGTLCLDENTVNQFNNLDSCVLTCEISNGVCSSSPVEGKVAFKKLDCPNGQLCYVSDNEKILSSDNMEIKKDSSLFESLIGSEGVARNILRDIFDSSKFLITIPDKIRLVIIMSYKEPFCYSFDTDNEEVKLSSGYISGKDDFYALNSDIMSYSGEKILSYTAWNRNEKLIMRWKLESRGMGNQYEKGEVIKNSEFGYKVRGAEAGKIFYVLGLKREWEIGNFWNRKKSLLVTYDYKIVKYNENKISIYAHDREKKVWHELYCNKALVNWWPGYSMKIRDVSDSLSDTLDENCMWNY